MDAIVPAAGEGTRLRPLTTDTPKPLVEVAGRPLIERVLDALVPAEPDRFVVVVGYRGQQVRERLGARYRDVPVGYVRQEERRGLAHALLRAAEVVDGPALVCNGDNVLESDLAYLRDAHEAARDGLDDDGAPPGDDTARSDGEDPLAATMLVQEVPLDRAREVGVVELDEDGPVRRVVEKPHDPSTHRVSAGAYAVEPAVFEACRAIDPADTGELEVADAITRLVERGYRVEPCELRGARVNVNEPDDVERAAALLDGGDPGRE